MKRLEFGVFEIEAKEHDLNWRLNNAEEWPAENNWQFKEKITAIFISEDDLYVETEEGSLAKVADFLPDPQKSSLVKIERGGF